MLSNIKFRKILNDLKRRPEDAAKDLKISLKNSLWVILKILGILPKYMVYKCNKHIKDQKESRRELNVANMTR